MYYTHFIFFPAPFRSPPRAKGRSVKMSNSLKLKIVHPTSYVVSTTLNYLVVAKKAGSCQSSKLNQNSTRQGKSCGDINSLETYCLDEHELFIPYIVNLITLFICQEKISFDLRIKLQKFFEQETSFKKVVLPLLLTKTTLSLYMVCITLACGVLFFINLLGFIVAF